MILEIDMGNTRLKWRLRKEMITLDQGIVMNNVVNYASLWQFDEPPAAILVSSVVAESGELDEWCQKAWSLQPRYAKVERYGAGVTNSYHELHQMGVDRWLAMMAAYAQWNRNMVVIDVGSACTIDLITHAGRHLGGYIVPGIALMRSTLLRNTTQVLCDESSLLDPPISPGQSTQDCVMAGLYKMFLGLLRESTNELRKRDEVQPLLIFTGGDGQILQRYVMKCVDFDVENSHYCPNLVLDGLCLSNIQW